MYYFEDLFFLSKFQYQWDMLNFEIVVMVKIPLFT